jgi:hypothetical protein
VAGPSFVVRVLGDATGFGKSMDASAKTAQSAASKAHDAFSSMLGTLNRAGVLGPFGDALAGIDDAIGKVVGHGKDIGTVMLGVGGALAGVGVGLQALGSKDQAAHQQLQASVQATGKDYEDYASGVEAAIKKQEGFGTSANVTQDALSKLTQATHDPQKALDLLGTAANVAASKHEDLATAAGQIGKVYNGNTKLLKDYGVSIDKTTGLTKDGKTATQALADVTAGQASAAADTFMGKLDGVKARVEDAAASFGQKYGPAITIAGAAMTGLGAAVETGSAAVTALKDSTLLQSAATKVAEAAQWLWNAAMDANPIGLVVLAIAGLVAALIFAYEKVGWFRDAVNDMGAAAVAAFNWVVNIAKVVFGWIAANWPLLVGILFGPFGMAAALILTHWDDILGFLKKLPGQITNIASGMWDGIYNAFKAMINFIIDAWNGLKFKTPSIDVLGVHTPSVTIGVPEIPHLAQGGLITQTGLIYAHAGEAITPAGRAGPALHIENATFSDAADVDLLMRQTEFAVAAGRL